VALRAAKVSINWGSRTDLRTGLTIERETFSDLFNTEDQKEGMRSFVEEGPGKAKFKGR
jgi:enoyl-CoA hydratase